MRIAVYGTGGAGGYFGAQLARAGHETILIARGEHLNAIKNDGLRLETSTGETVITPALATDDPAQAGHVDVVLLGVKAWQVAEAAERMKPLIGPNTVVAPLQNGVEAPSQLSAVLGREHVLGGLCGTFSWIIAPGRIRSIGRMNYIKFGELDNTASERTDRLCQAFEDAGVDVEVPRDIHKALWDKFLLTASFGGMGAITRAPIGVIRSMPGTLRILQECMDEIFRLSRACSVVLANTAVSDTMKLVHAMPEDATTSLQRDIMDGRPSELEAWNGAVVRLAQEHGVPVPLHDFIYNCLLPQEQRARGSA